MVSSMIGTGIFVTSGYLGHDIQDPFLVLLLWLVGGVAALAGALCYAELGVLLPRPGGEYTFLRTAFGPLWGFLSGWATFLWGFSAPIAVFGLAFSKHAATFFPGLDPETAAAVLPGGITPGHLTAGLLILLLSSLHFHRVSSGIVFQNAITVVKVLALVVLVALALASGQGEAAGLLERGNVPEMPRLLAAAGTGLLFVSFSYSGWNAAIYLAGEVKDPRRTLPRAALWGTLAVTAIYLLMNVVYLLAVPVTRMSPTSDIAARAAEAYFGERGRQAASVVVLLALLGAISAVTLSGSRVCFAMSEAGPVWGRLGRVSGKGSTPRAAVAFQGITAACLAVFLDVVALLIHIGLVLVFFSALSAAALLALRRRAAAGAAGAGAASGAASGAAAPDGSFRAPLGAVLPLAYIVFSAVILAQAVAAAPREAAIGLTSVLAGIPLYALSRRSAR
jgi:APA family basic amino acid/polyamine antiporter